MRDRDVPFYVEFRIGLVVMAPCESLAPDFAKQHVRDAISDGAELEFDSTIELKSLTQLASIDPAWSGDCLPYGDDGSTTLGEILPE